MPQVKPPKQQKRSSYEPQYEEQEQYYAPPQDTFASIFFAIILLVSIVVGASAWLGGGVPRVNAFVANKVDGITGGLGFSVKRVDVFGLSENPNLEKAVRLAARVEPGENMWRANPKRIQQNILTLGQVQKVRVARYWPNQIIIYAEPITAVATLYENGDYYWVDATGKKTALAESLMQAQPSYNVMHVEGGGASAEVAKLMQALTPFGLHKIQARWHQGRRWVLFPETGVRVHLPYIHDGAAFEQGIKNWQRLKSATQDVAISDFDLRVPNRIIIKSENTDLIKQKIHQGGNYG